jgi:putative N6-adenine-specific DNA methylase
MAEPLSIFVACAPGLEPLLADEVRALGLGAPEAQAGGVSFAGGFDEVLRANLELGLASRVLVRIAQFRAVHLAELAKKAGRLPWRRWIAEGTPVAVHATSRRSRLYHTGAIAERVGRAAGGVVGAEAVVQEDVATDADAPVTIHVRFERDTCTVSLDTSGAPLHRRGYRLATAKAPLREDLARALVVASGWDRDSPLLDPMMGSGTIVIEAAMLARRLPPGSLRERFAFMSLVPFDATAWQRVLEGAMDGALPSLPFRIYGRDRNPGALRAATGNAERAGVQGDLDLARASLGPLPWEPEQVTPRGALVTNPPHGRRIGGKSLNPLYRRLGQVVNSLPADWRVAILASDRRLALRTGLPLTTALLTEQGGTKVRFLTPRALER